MSEPEADPRGSHHPVLSLTLAVSHALCVWLMYPSANLWPLAFIAPLPLAWMACRARSLRWALFVTLATQVPLWLWMNGWMAAVSMMGWPLGAVCMSLYGALFVALIRRVACHARLGRLPRAISLPIVWVGLEVLRGEVAFHGYPWFLLGHPLVEWPVLAQSSGLLGAYFTSFLAASVSGALLEWASPGRGRTTKAGCIVAAALLLLNLGYGMWSVARPVGEMARQLDVLVVQTNLPQDNKIGWPYERQEEDVDQFILETHRGYRAATSAGQTVDVIVWPETMLPGFGLEPETIEYLVANRYRPGNVFSGKIIYLASELGVPMIVGSGSYFGLRAVGSRWEWDQHFNSAYLVSGDPPFARYDKMFLVPFGEVIPYVSQWPALEHLVLKVAAAGMKFDVDAGEEPVVLSIDAGQDRWRIATPICFEDAMSRICRRLVYEGGEKRADVLINLSNDGWFAAHEAGRQQHVQIARFRAIENGVPLVRAANTGCSVAIDSRGFVVERIGEGRYGTGQRPGSLHASVRSDARRTLFGRVGNLWGWTCLAGLVLLLLAPLVYRRG